MSKFSVNLSWAGYLYNLVADNNQIIMTSQLYTSKDACLKGVESVQNNASDANVEDQTVKDFEIKGNPKFEVYKDDAGKFRFHLKAGNGQIIGTSHDYSTKASCLKGVESVKDIAEDADVVEEKVFADKVILGNIFSADKEQAKAEAVAIVDFRLAYFGNAEGIKEYIGKNTVVERLEKDLILPFKLELGADFR